MSKIKVLALGGLNENGKNLYVIEIDNKILVFDAGLKYAPDKMLGIDYIIPDFKYLKENKERIIGLFISHAHYENIGAVTDLIREIPELNVYCTKFASNIILEEAKEDKVDIKNINVIKAYKKLEFGEFSIFPFNVSHSVPESVGYAINTKDGVVVYMADFLIDSTMSGNYEMDLGKIAYIGKQGVLLLMCESLFCEKKGFTSPNHHLNGYFNNVIDKHEGRIIFSLLPLHIKTMQEIFDSLKGKRRKVVIMGKKLQTIVNMCVSEGYLEVDKDIIGDLTNLKDSNSVVLVSNDRENPYYNLNRIVNGYDKFITLEKTDTICFAEPSYDAYEITVTKLLNDIAIKGANIVTIPKDKSVRYHASSEDIMLLTKLFNPKYYMPIKGEYRYQVNNAKLVENIGIKPENIFLKENGDVVNIVDGEHVDDFEHINVDDILIDGKSTSDVGELVLKDREMLADNGLVLVSATLDKKTKELLTETEVLTRGFIYVKDNKEMISEIKKLSMEIIKDNISNNYADYGKIRNDIRELIGKYIYKETECKPMILTVIQEI